LVEDSSLLAQWNVAGALGERDLPAPQGIVVTAVPELLSDRRAHVEAMVRRHGHVASV